MSQKTTARIKPSKAKATVRIKPTTATPSGSAGSPNPGHIGKPAFDSASGPPAAAPSEDDVPDPTDPAERRPVGVRVSQAPPPPPAVRTNPGAAAGQPHSADVTKSGGPPWEVTAPPSGTANPVLGFSEI